MAVCSRSVKAESCTTTVRGIATVSAVHTVIVFLDESASRPLTISPTASTATDSNLPRSAVLVRNQSQVTMPRCIYSRLMMMMFACLFVCASVCPFFICLYVLGSL